MAIWSMCVSPFFLLSGGHVMGDAFTFVGSPGRRDSTVSPGAGARGRDALEDTWEVSLVELGFAP